MNILVHIDHLTLDGLPIDQQRSLLLEMAMVQELTRLLKNGNSTFQHGTGGTPIAVNGGSIRVAEHADPGGLGKQIATAVYRRLGDRP